MKRLFLPTAYVPRRDKETKTRIPIVTTDAWSGHFVYKKIIHIALGLAMCKEYKR